MLKYLSHRFDALDSNLRESLIDKTDATIILFPGCFHLEDNPCIKYAEKRAYKYSIALLSSTTFNNRNATTHPFSNIESFEVVPKSNESGLRRYSGSSFSEALQIMIDDKDISSNVFIYYKANVEPVRKISMEIASVLLQHGFEGIAITDDVDYPFRGQLVFSPSLYKSVRPAPSARTDPEVLHIVSDYFSLGETAFSNKYAERYISELCRSPEHLKSYRRLLQLDSNGALKSALFFQGEVLSGVFSRPISSLGASLLVNCWH